MADSCHVCSDIVDRILKEHSHEEDTLVKQVEYWKNKYGKLRENALDICKDLFDESGDADYCTNTICHKCDSRIVWDFDTSIYFYKCDEKGTKLEDVEEMGVGKGWFDSMVDWNQQTGMGLPGPDRGCCDKCYEKFKECDKCHYVTDEFVLVKGKHYCNRFCKDTLELS